MSRTWYKRRIRIKRDYNHDVQRVARRIVDGKPQFDGLRAVAAQMTMDELHENRAEFVQEVQNAVSEDLLKNGLELESVSHRSETGQ